MPACAETHRARNRSNLTYDRCPLTLIGEEIAGPWNSAALSDIAHDFGGTYLDYCGDCTEAADGEPPPILSRFDCLIAAENLAGAQSVYSYRPPGFGSAALIVGNEAKGLRRRTRKQAHVTVQIPTPSRNIDCLNVAAAAAVMLAYFALEQPLPYKQRSLAAIQRTRPGALLAGGSDHLESGTRFARSARFGWDRVFLADRGDAWYECDRRIKSEGRGTARRGRNPIKVLPYRVDGLSEYRRAIVFTSRPGVRAPYQLPLIGSDALIVLQDEADGSAPWRPPAGWPGDVTYASLPQVSLDRYHYRQMSAIALAEVARQLGEPASGGIYLHGRGDRYRREVKAEQITPTLDLEDLKIF